MSRRSAPIPSGARAPRTRTRRARTCSATTWLACRAAPAMSVGSGPAVDLRGTNPGSEMTKMPDERYGAFCTHDPVRLNGAPSGPLAGLSFAAKDAFEVEGQRICGGNPDWLRTHDP